MAKRAGGEGSSPRREVSGVSGRIGGSSSGTARAGATAIAKATRGSGVGTAVASRGRDGGRLGRGLAADAAAAVAEMVADSPTTTPPTATASGGTREGPEGSDQGRVVAVAGALQDRIERVWQGDVGQSIANMLAKVAHGMPARREVIHAGHMSADGAMVPAGGVSVRGTDGVTAVPVVVQPPPPFPQANCFAAVNANSDCGSEVSGCGSVMTNDSDVNGPVVVVASDSDSDVYSSCYSGIAVDNDDEDDYDDEDVIDDCDEEEKAAFERAKALLHARLGVSLAQAKNVERQVAALEVKNYELRTLLHVHAQAVAKESHKSGRIHSQTAAL